MTSSYNSDGRPLFAQDPSVHFVDFPSLNEGENFGWQQRIMTGVNRLLTYLQRSTVDKRAEIIHTFPLLLSDVNVCPPAVQLLIDHQQAEDITIAYTKEGDGAQSMSVEASDRESTLFLSYYPSEDPLVIPGVLMSRSDKRQETSVSVTREDFRKWLTSVLGLEVAPDDPSRATTTYRSNHEVAATTKEVYSYTLTPKDPTDHPERTVRHSVEYVFGRLIAETFSIEYETGTPGRTIEYTQRYTPHTANEGSFIVIDRNNLEQTHQVLLPDEGDSRRLSEILEDESAALCS